MSGFALLESQKAIYSKLSGDATLGAMISGVFDRVPEQADYPYVTIGDAQWQDWSTQGQGGSEITMTLYAYSRKAGRKESLDILARIYALLHEGTLSMSGQNLIVMRCTQGSVRLMEDGLSYQGALELRLLIASA